MKVLITGFDPFGGESINPAYEAVKLLPDTICGAEIIKLEIPTVYGKVAKSLMQKLKNAIQMLLSALDRLVDVLVLQLKKLQLILQKPELKITTDSSQWIHH